MEKQQPDQPATYDGEMNNNYFGTQNYKCTDTNVQHFIA